jgi:hypothetical protein
MNCDSSEPGRFRIGVRWISSYGPDYGSGKGILKFHRPPLRTLSASQTLIS